MPQLKQMWNELKDKGLHIIHAEMQGHPKEEVEKFCRQHGVEFPNIVGGVPGYEGGRGIPYSFVIGVDGTVIWQGGGSGYHSVIHQEIQKVKYPGLGKLEVAKGAQGAAAKFAGKQYAKAIADAEKAIAKAEEKDDSETVADAKYVIEHANLVGDRLKAKAEKQKSEREFAAAIATYQEISASFKGMAYAEEAKAALKEMKKDLQVKKELKAEAALDMLEKKIATVNDPQDRIDMLNQFAQAYDGMKAAERARELASWQ